MFAGRTGGPRFEMDVLGADSLLKEDQNWYPFRTLRSTATHRPAMWTYFNRRDSMSTSRAVKQRPYLRHFPCTTPLFP